ncbi:RES family NAD+ phosphorylase [Pseudoalteromonas ruthenica]|uniref:RES family NAD+ phosphorylase n=1 Tax=Pseudoalteromonas ruthenica TaxID=151081 RepID=UPI0006988031|nr:RES family NAD+ phosphorylase [Pseudoalteromonas ruthenica]TMO89364.1 RES domain-containing protein [Pseudoalteromonas ruthenica]TMO94602.1 RES domain-containing protein [Pseudoalteromonas ruthenica]TMP00015.1 RES domain-containing protein [Pseudoalteromonas ruthenica]TMP09193.1 RES domain-containing protein [Pseudoalteromonas ruthenica]TMP12225.1 RES domain-containing protein [Pseudoalteromonas ruthenica]
MTNDNFLTTDDIERFFNEVKHTNRTFLSSDSLDFLERLEVLCHKHEKVVNKGTKIYRARKGVCLESKIDKNTFIPPKNVGSEGRANAYNINVLYAADNVDIAVAEVRAIALEKVLVATLVVNHDLKIIDFAKERPGWDNFFGLNGNEDMVSKKEFHERDCLLKIGAAFSKPLTVDDSRRDYIPTQIIAEYFKSKGYDGIAYQSQFSVYDKDALHRNYAFFDYKALEPVNFQARTVQRVIVGSQAIAPPVEI